jgi:hypothetical protein
MRREEPQEKEDAYEYPYSLFILQSVNATRCLAWEESKLGCSKKREEVQRPELILIEEVNMNSEHLYRTVGVRIE